MRLWIFPLLLLAPSCDFLDDLPDRRPRPNQVEGRVDLASPTGDQRYDDYTLILENLPTTVGSCITNCPRQIGQGVAGLFDPNLSVLTQIGAVCSWGQGNGPFIEHWFLPDPPNAFDPTQSQWVQFLFQSHQDFDEELTSANPNWESSTYLCMDIDYYPANPNNNQPPNPNMFDGQDFPLPRWQFDVMQGGVQVGSLLREFHDGGITVIGDAYVDRWAFFEDFSFLTLVQDDFRLVPVQGDPSPPQWFQAISGSTQQVAVTTFQVREGADFDPQSQQASCGYGANTQVNQGG